MVFIKLVKHANLKSFAFQLLKIYRHKNYPQKRMSHQDIYPLESRKIREKSLSMLGKFFRILNFSLGLDFIVI